MASVEKYGVNNFQFSVVEFIPIKMLERRERFWILKFKSNQQRFGYNKTSGGEKTELTLETRMNISKGLIGAVYSDPKERSRNLSKALMGRKCSKSHRKNISKGNSKRFSDEKEIQKVRDAAPKTSVYKIDLNGNILAEFVSMREAERQTGVSSSCISRCCKGIRKTTDGFSWMFKIPQILTP